MSMNAFLRAVGILFRAHLVRTFRTRRGYIVIALAALPVALAFLAEQVSRLEGPFPHEALTGLVWLLLIQTIVPLTALVGASSVIAEEIEDRTITYLVTRPIPRPAILVGRWLAAALPIALVLGLAAWLVVGSVHRIGGEAGADWVAADLRGRVVVTAMLGGAVYSGLFAAAGALFKRPMLVGLAYVFVYEGFLGNLPGSSQASTVVFHLKSFLFWDAPGLMGEIEEALLATTLAEPAAAVRTLVLVLASALALGSWRFARREYVLAS
jgi:ABC-2 type transport system permease protein